MDMAVGMGDPVGMQIGMVVLMLMQFVHSLSPPLSVQYLPYYTRNGNASQALWGDILREINVLTGP